MYLPTNFLLLKYQLNNANKCTLCNIQVEKTDHLYCHCIHHVHIQNSWREFRSWWKKYKDLKATLKNILLGYVIHCSRPYQ